MTVRLVQVSDPHVGATWGHGDPALKLAVVVEAVRVLRPAADAVVLTGDLTDHATDAEYAAVRELLRPLPVPVHVLPGNHDDPGALGRHFGLADAVRVGDVRLVLADTTIPGSDAGALDVERLDATLSREPDVPTLLAMHHPPLATGVRVEDGFALAADDRERLATALERHPQVLRVLAGHLHRVVVGDLAGRPVLTAPSTYVQARLDPATGEQSFGDDPPGFAVHDVDGRAVRSAVHAV